MLAFKRLEMKELETLLSLMTWALTVMASKPATLKNDRTMLRANLVDLDEATILTYYILLGQASANRITWFKNTNLSSVRLNLYAKRSIFSVCTDNLCKCRVMTRM